MPGRPMLGAVKSLLRTIRHMPDRLRHRSRGRRLRAWLDTRTSVESVAFICHGNINRSAYAAAAFARLVPPDLRDAVLVRSAGFIGPGRPASALACRTAQRRGLDLGAHRSRLIDPDELRRTDLIVVMNQRQRADIVRLLGRSDQGIIVLGDLDPLPIERRAVQDPYGRSEATFETVFTRIDRCIDALARALWQRKST